MSADLSPDEEAAMWDAYGEFCRSGDEHTGEWEGGWLAARRYDRAEMIAKRAQIANYILAEMTHNPDAISAAYRAADAIIAGDVSKWPPRRRAGGTMS